MTIWQINWKIIFSGITWLFQNFESLSIIILIICFHELSSRSKWVSSGKNSSMFQIKSCENNIETFMLFQDDPSYFVISSKLSPQIESIMNGSEGYCATFKLVGCHLAWFSGTFWLGSMRRTCQASNNSMIKISW